MTRTTSPPDTSRRRGCAGSPSACWRRPVRFAIMATDGVDARPRSSSEVVAAEADRALDSLESWNVTQNPADYVRFVQARESAALLTAAELEVDPDQLRDEWAAVASEKQQAVLAALSQLGVAYRNRTSQPGVGFDCSGLTIWAFDQAGRRDPARQQRSDPGGSEVELDEAEAGDLVYYPGHISDLPRRRDAWSTPRTPATTSRSHTARPKSLRFGDTSAPQHSSSGLSGVESLSTTGGSGRCRLGVTG